MQRARTIEWPIGSEYTSPAFHLFAEPVNNTFDAAGLKEN